MESIQFSTEYHQKVESNDFYKTIRQLIQITLDDHLCAADEQESFDENTSGIGVSGKKEAAMFIAQFIHKTIKLAWEDGWRVRDKSCGRNKNAILQKKHADYDAFKSALINDIK